MRHRARVCIAICSLTLIFGAGASGQESIEGGELAPTPEISFAGEVTVTGSLIPRADLTALSPVAVMEVPQELTYSGTVRIEDLLRTMPQVFAEQNSTDGAGTTQGTATISLRYLGPQRTLVLINGRRLAYGDIDGADLNAIPAPLVKRVDVLTGGASAVYGSDALAGVVNFIMDTGFTGVRGGAQYSVHNHDNSNEVAQRINEEAGFEYPTGLVTDGDAINANVALGGKFADGKGHAVAYIDYRTIDSLKKADRDYFNCSVGAGPDGPFCGGSRTTSRGTFWAWSPDWMSVNGIYTLDLRDEGGDGHSFRPWMGERFNYGPYNHIQRPDEKYNAGAFANYEINEHFDVYMEVMYMNDYTDAQMAPSGNFGTNEPISCENPMLSSQQWELLCGPDTGYEPTDSTNVTIFRRNVEGDPRTSQIGHTNSRLVAGLRGDVDDAWGYDFYLLRAQNDTQFSWLNDLDVERIGNALDVIEDPDTGEWVCRSEQARANGCVPWNVFQEGAVTQDAVDYISTVAVSYDTQRTELANLTFTGDLEAYGVKIPSASEGLQLAIGVEARREWLKFVPDEVLQAGVAGAGGQGTEPLEGSYSVRELFIEALVPVVQDVRGARDLSLELGYRYSDYSSFGGFDTYKAMISWAITDSWRLRGGYNRAVRAPSLWELYGTPWRFGEYFQDPCEGPSPVAALDECARTGVTAEQYGNIPPTPPELNPTVNTEYGGNAELNPEVGDTYTAGIVWTPQSIGGLSVTADYYDIRITDAIGTLTAETVTRVCMESADPIFCDRIHRDRHGSLWVTEDGYIDLTDQNVGSLGAEGIDLNANYLIGLGNAGFLATDLLGSYTLANNLSDPEFNYECVGYFGSQCGQPMSVWRHRLRATWETSFRLNLSLAWRYLGSVDNDDASSNPDLADPDQMETWRINGSDRIRAFNWFDFAASYTMRNGLKFTVGVNNILDEEPPLLPGLADHRAINLYANYDPLGRYIFGSVQFNF
jgi:outer membrane receptor protein involved in Fe transport